MKRKGGDPAPGQYNSLHIIEAHSSCIWSLACVGTNYNVMSASDDGSIRRWRQDGEPVGKHWEGNGGGAITSPWHSDALSITVVSLKVYNTCYNCNALPCHNLMHY
jgi:WD40 repeat protein